MVQIVGALMLVGCHSDILVMFDPVPATVYVKDAYYSGLDRATILLEKIKCTYYQICCLLSTVYKVYCTLQKGLSFNIWRVATPVLALKYLLLLGYSAMYHQGLAKPAIQWHQQALIEHAVLLERARDYPPSARLALQRAIAVTSKLEDTTIGWMQYDKTEEDKSHLRIEIIQCLVCFCWRRSLR